MEQSPRLSLSYVAPSQAQKHVTVNETFRRLDALVQLTVRSRKVSAEPASPAEGDGYILPASPTGAAWDNYAADDLAFFQDGAWVSIASVEGVRAFVADEGDMVVFDGAAWTPIAVGEDADKFGVNATADATNRLSVKSDAVLFSHDDVTPGSGDAQVKVNKAAAGDTASHLFQTGFSGRAEFGLTGDDDFHVKVSPNGSSWNEAFIVDKDTGDTTFTERMVMLTGSSMGEPVVQIECEGVTTPATPMRMTRYSDNSLPPVIFGRKARGTRASPGAVQSGDTLFQFNLQGYHSGGDFGAAVGQLRFVASENFTSSAQGAEFQVRVTENGNSASFEAFRVANDGAVQMGGANTVIDKNRHHQLRSYTVAGLPSAATAGQMIYVSDETGGAVPAFSDGTNWRRVTDRAVVA